MHTLPFSPILTATNPIKHLDNTPKQPVQTLATTTTADTFEKQPTVTKPQTAIRTGEGNSLFVEGMTALTGLVLIGFASWQQDKVQKEQDARFQKLQARNDQLVDKLAELTTKSIKNEPTQPKQEIIQPIETPKQNNARAGIEPGSAAVGFLVHQFAPHVFKFVESKFAVKTMDAEALKALKAAKVAYNLAETHYSSTEKAKLYTEAINKFETAIVSIKETHPDIAVLAKATQLSAYIKHGDYNEQAIKIAAQQVKDLMQEVYAPSYEYKGIVISSNYNPINAFNAKECYPTAPKKDNHYWTNANPLNTFHAVSPSPEFKEQMTLRNNAIDAYKMDSYLFDGWEGVHYELFTRNDNSVLNVVNKILKPDYYIPTEVIFRHTLGYDDKLQSTFGRIDDSGLGRISEVIFDAKKSPNWVLPQKTTPALKIGGKYCSPDDLRELYYGAQKNKDNIRVLQGTAKRNSPSEWGYYVK